MGALPSSPSAPTNGGDRSSRATSRTANGTKRSAEDSTAAPIKSQRKAGGTTRRPLILTIGTRGDVQPFLPLVRGMQEKGWEPLLVSLPMYTQLAADANVPYAPIVDDVSAMAPCVDNPTYPPAFFCPMPLFTARVHVLASSFSSVHVLASPTAVSYPLFDAAVGRPFS